MKILLHEKCLPKAQASKKIHLYRAVVHVVAFSAIMDHADCNEVVKGGIAASKRSWDVCFPRKRHLRTGIDNSSGPVLLVRAITVRGPK